MIDGIGGLAAPSPRILLLEQLHDPLRGFLPWTPVELLDKLIKRRQFRELLIDVEGTMQTAEDGLLKLSPLFSTENLCRLAHLATSQTDRARTARLSWNETTGTVEIE